MPDIHTVAAARHEHLVGAKVVSVRTDGGLVYVELQHGDDGCVLLVRATETGWVFPEVEPIPA